MKINVSSKSRGRREEDENILEWGDENVLEREEDIAHQWETQVEAKVGGQGGGGPNMPAFCVCTDSNQCIMIVL